MKITCPACGAEYNVDPSRIPAAGLNMRCPKCSQSFRVSSDGSTQSEQQTGKGTQLDGGGQAIKSETFYVKRPTGKVFGPFDRNALQMMLKTEKLGGNAEVSTDKQNWQPILEVPAFSQFVPDKSLPDFGDANPKATMMGGWQNQRSEADLPARKGSADLPAPKRPGAPPDLPAPKRQSNADLPAPKQSNRPELPARKKGSRGGPGLPVPKSKAGADLPAPKSGADLPTPKSGADLPTPKSGADLPAPKSGADLPTPRSDADLPRPRSGDDDLPRPRAGGTSDDLFGDGGGGGDDLFGDGGDDDLFGDGGGDDLFGDGGGGDDDDLFGAPLGGDDDDLFGDAGGGDDDLFGAPDDDDDLFGSPQAPPEPDDDDLFGAPDDDLFAAPGGTDEESDLFGEPSEADDLFDRSPAGGGEDDDFLGGDAGFSFLDDEPVADDVDDWGDDLFGSEASEAETAASEPIDDWGDDLLEEPSRPTTTSSSPILDADDPFRPASPGIRQEEPEAESAHVSREEAVDSDRKRGSAMLIAVPVLVVALIGVGYYVVTNYFLSEETGTTKVTTSVGPKSLDVDSLKSDNFSDYSILTDAKAKPADEGKWLFAQSMMLIRYPDAGVAERGEALAKKLRDASDGWAALGRGAWEARAGNADAARAYLEPLASGDSDVAFFANLTMGIGDTLAVEAEIEKSGKPAAPRKNTPPTSQEELDEDQPSDEQAPAEEQDGETAEENDAEDPEENEEETPAEEPDQQPAEEEKSADSPAIPAAYSTLVERAQAAFDAAAKADPSSALPHFWKGRLSMQLGADEDAATALKTAVENGPSHVGSHVLLGEVRYEQGELNEAIDLVEKVSGELSKHASNSEKAEALHFAGLIHVARRQSDLAIDSFTKALSIDPSRSDTLRALAEEYERAQKYKEALNFFTTNKNLGQDDPEVMLGIVRSHIGLEQWSRAISALEEGQDKFPEDARFPYYLGQLYMKRGAFTDARKPLEQAVEIDDQLLTAQATLAQLSWRMDKDIQQGERYVQNIVQHPEDLDATVASQVAEYYRMSGRRGIAEQWYREALALDPNHWPARLALAKLLLEEKKQQQARDLLERARKEGVQDVRLSAYLADAYRQSTDYDRAIDEINKVIEAFPKNPRYVFIRGRIHFDRGNFDTAQKDFQKAYDFDPTFYDAYFFVGRTAFERGDYSNALKIFRHVLDYKPDRGDFRFYMARTLERENRATQALEEYRKVTAVDPAYGIENPMVYVHRGRLLSRLGYAREGKADIARALELAPDSVHALLAMGETEYLDKQYDAAIEHFNRALQMEPEHPEAQFKLGMAYLFTDRRQDAAQRLQLAIKHGYEDPEVFKRLGYLYRDLGQRSQALAAFKKFLEKAEGHNVPAATKREILGQIDRLN
jgi:predicted Zn finger-like uncharacterized protein